MHYVHYMMSMHEYMHTSFRIPHVHRAKRVLCYFVMYAVNASQKRSCSKLTYIFTCKTVPQISGVGCPQSRASYILFELLGLYLPFYFWGSKWSNLYTADYTKIISGDVQSVAPRIISHLVVLSLLGQMTQFITPKNSQGSNRRNKFTSVTREKS